MIRLAEERDIEKIARTYTELLQYEEINGSNSNWKRNVYPIVSVPENKVLTGTMYVLEKGEEICASMVLNHEQAPEYADIKWKYPAVDEQVLVIHTLCIPPQYAGKGYGRKMVEYAKEYAMSNGCSVIRIDTYAHNEPAKNFIKEMVFVLLDMVAYYYKA